MRNQEEKKIELQNKVDRIIHVRNITFLAARPPFYVIFYGFISLLLPFRLLTFYVGKNFFCSRKLPECLGPCICCSYFASYCIY